MACLLLIALGVIAAAQVELTVNQGVSRENVEVGDDVTVTVSLTNSGSSATEVNIVAVLPSGVSGTVPISGVRDATGNMNVWSGTLAPTETKSLVFIIRSNEPGHKTVFSTIKYTDGGIERKIQLTSEITATKPQLQNTDTPTPPVPEKNIPGFTSLALLMGLGLGILIIRKRRI
ncbi:Uncharacterised protein [uncultured archaeon]|nr:Uncharacterised protein [uncultured archaeon]